MSCCQTLSMRLILVVLVVVITFIITDADHAEQQPASAGAHDLINHATGDGTKALRQCHCRRVNLWLR